jgi:hypothetical protein
LFECAEILFDLSHRIGIVFLNSEVEELSGVIKPGRQLVQHIDDLLELRPLLA